jgi:4-oxalomesaconate hydratase
MGKNLLVIGAHSADFVWRTSGITALVTSQGGSANVIALSYGERGESGELWKDPDQTVENVKRIRHEQAKVPLPRSLGLLFRCLDLGDYPLKITDSAMEQMIELFREFQPDIVLTHTPIDPFNPDHPEACQGSKSTFIGFRSRRRKCLQAHYSSRPVLLRTAPTGAVRFQT